MTAYSMTPASEGGTPRTAYLVWADYNDMGASIPLIQYKYSQKQQLLHENTTERHPCRTGGRPVAMIAHHGHGTWTALEGELLPKSKHAVMLPVNKNIYPCNISSHQ